MERINQTLAQMMNRKEVREAYESIRRRTLEHPGVITFLKAHPELDETAIEVGFTKLSEYAEQMDGKKLVDEQAVIPGHQPVLYVDLGQIAIRYEETVAHRQARRQKEMDRKFKSLFLPEEVREASFQSFDYSDDARKIALREAMRFVSGMKTRQKVNGLYLYGSFGVGKTYLLAAIANELKVADIETILVHAPGFVSEAKRKIRTDSFDSFLTSFQHVPILLIDDIGAEAISPWVRDELFGIILQYRMMHRLPTLYSSNFSSEELETHFSIDGSPQNKMKAQRLMQRISTTTTQIELKGENRRR
ncbi:primosomal protein DnaI [Exiguobacterium sp. SH3S2]|uniref:primosomal protein DnaI n=1 Tax=Exiguobacterium TaxID=33986 RepID=UPI0008776FDB|nr:MULTISPECIES: primosomal protein DnaI [Exiguobacterium]OGX80164.1 primosomal protein DnaI [Exiguobacterium sp. SH31]TCI25650.1 primosomal protein DnaI [Exiguobacterium sp. SH5S4]TCI39517.1 primosomal protein DnaI [Exiguobacterium sp. SH4S7]TCI47789.1 primosomal protein DnaI [Exiguobacterium sp. SH5S32]TCI48779.1 primosomal protein DnaI [Exiguobacterium sp. SH3S3]